LYEATELIYSMVHFTLFRGSFFVALYTLHLQKPVCAIEHGLKMGSGYVQNKLNMFSNVLHMVIYVLSTVTCTQIIA